MLREIEPLITCSPAIDHTAQFFNKWLPTWLAVGINRWRYILFHTIIFQFCMKFPEAAKRLLKRKAFKQVKSAMSEEDFQKHFSPPYDPWTQRLCVCPGGDFFAAIRDLVKSW